MLSGAYLYLQNRQPLTQAFFLHLSIYLALPNYSLARSYVTHGCSHLVARKVVLFSDAIIGIYKTTEPWNYFEKNCKKNPNYFNFLPRN